MSTYPMPFPKGAKYDEIKEDENSEPNFLSHRNFVHTFYAKDLAVEVGTPVLTIQDGEVLSVKNDSDRYINPKTDPRYSVLFRKGKESLPLEMIKKLKDELMDFAAKYTNYVEIQQVDGIIAQYMHLERNVRVAVGQKLKDGDEIGAVGMKGVTTSPHLHINLVEIRSVPFELKERI